MALFSSLTLFEGIALAIALQFLLLFWVLVKQAQQKKLTEQLGERIQQTLISQLHQLHIDLSQSYQTSQQFINEKIAQGQLATQQLISDAIQRQMADVREQMTHSFKHHASSLTSHLQLLTEEIRNHLNTLTQQVNHKLTEGFEKTSSTFIDVVKRLTIIDEAQKKITELSSHVVSLQDVLVDKKARGAFGEVQLSTLISNMLPSASYQMQYTLSNQKRADCILFLPEPTGNIVIDAKFPLETYQRLINSDALSTDRKSLQQQFRQDIQKHIKDIAEKYIVPNETTDGAMMFIPAESIFAEIHANYPDLIAMSQKLKVWLVSPSTLMAVLTTARAVLKDDATRKQIHIIQKHLQALANDFQRFEKRMDKLSKHIDLAHQDVNEVNTSAKKITSRFQKIESVDIELDEHEVTQLELVESESI
ncbi:TPA: DNA recombination protein RmuC [Legionella pneumophila subsp. pneumophila]|uniref:DNA recombination protein RmuC n=1 Tax=Legionella pneumophila TaxID=446 RepID=UPI000770879E|nr:DNA recombination protein RmuC [Legionella pneumophila]HAT9215237.1 DNA recombination protein RmuC [Legionella pneumophila subsp. pneumophila]CZI18368.1 DNA recombination protein rmuC [Legionella pneumophila]HAT9261871.1 DNA recombination protein RmuC [Legionella pneumophila subsp. pneumophila]HAT9282302.1 DNA recombination protein RmuC [Legionella pneumophila subsp. pneumophila]HAT9288238.1 DNA recombination protein RmuC [Legionella pneumophila subsp. pneumophila]